MTIWIGITDNAWFDFLSAMKPDEVNFWHPSGPCSFRVLQPGEIFFFKLKSPRRKIAGWARFVTHFNMPLSLAWRTFESKNGARDFRSFSEMILRHGSDKHQERWIGCTTLNNPVFLDEDEWFDPPSNWPVTGIQQGKRYTSDDPMAASLVEAALLSESAVALETRELSDDDARYGSAYLTRARLGQGAFKTLVLQAYNSHCAMTGEKTLPVLEAAHIRQYAEGGPHRTSNGLLLRSDLHTLFDAGYMTVTPDYHIEVSPRIREEFNNGKEYYALHGRSLVTLPDNPTERPSREFLDWHNQKVFGA